jgi:hypothetical protein
MRPKKNSAFSIAAYLTLATGIWLGGLPLLAIAQTYVPPDRGLPGRREGGGTRSGSCATGQPTLTALTPDKNFGQTVSPYPTWFWYVPETSAQAAEFVLLDSNNVEVYKAIFQIANQSGIISLSLPEHSNLSPLTVGQDYHWYFSLICDRRDRSGDIYTEGWIQRIQPDSALTQQLASAVEGDRSELYATNGIWYDAVSNLADLRRLQSNNSTYRDNWNTLLRSVGLENLAAQPLVQCCEPNPKQPDDSPTSEDPGGLP